MKKLFPGKIFSIVLFVVVAFAAYFINVEVQSYLGRQALEKAGLQSLTLKDALAKAKAENKLVLVDVSAIWCPNCRKLDNEIFANSEVKKVIGENLPSRVLNTNRRKVPNFSKNTMPPNSRIYGFWTAAEMSSNT